LAAMVVTGTQSPWHLFLPHLSWDNVLLVPIKASQIDLVYSYRLSIVTFWSLIFYFIWAGPHHLFVIPLYLMGPKFGGFCLSINADSTIFGGMIKRTINLAGAWTKLRQTLLKLCVFGALRLTPWPRLKAQCFRSKMVKAIATFSELDVLHTYT